MSGGRIIVVGTGLAGFTTARTLRSRGFDGALSLIGREVHRPYDRPPLTKGYLTGVMSAADLALDDDEAPLEVHWQPGIAAVGLDPATRTVVTDDGDSQTADHIVVATGADATRLGGLDPGVAGVHALRTIDDAERLRADGVAGRDVIVVGSGFLACEAAASAVALGAASVQVVGPEPLPLQGRLGAVGAAALAALHRRHGVVHVGGSRVREVLVGATGRARGVALIDGRVIDGDLVIEGIGARPSTGWLAASGLAMEADGAIACDDRGRTEASGIWAVGDCARWGAARPEADTAPRPPAVVGGHWQDAVDQAAAVAATILGLPAGAVGDPYCWSDQFDVRIQVAGRLTGGETAHVRAGSVESCDLLVGFERDGIETAILGMNRAREITRWRRTRRRDTTALAS